MDTIRSDLAAARTLARSEVGAPGTWWDDAERVGIAAETRCALQCRLCAARKAALSPSMVAVITMRPVFRRRRPARCGTSKE